jgi:hypothetical protein
MPHEITVLDANLLVLLIIGGTSLPYITKHKRLQTYSESDFTLLVELLSSASGVIVTPNTLTEASNLVGYISEPARTRIYEQFRALTNAVDERYLESSRAVKRVEFLRLGLTDAVLLDVVDGAYTLLTADLDLYLAATTRGFKAVNFNRYRAM